MAPLTSDDVLNVKFQVSSFKEGYNQDEVDEFLDEVTTTMRGLEERLGALREPAGPSHRRAEILLTSDNVRSIRFATTRKSSPSLSLHGICGRGFCLSASAENYEGFPACPAATIPGPLNLYRQGKDISSLIKIGRAHV